MTGINWLNRENSLSPRTIAAPRSLVLSCLFRTAPGPRIKRPNPRPRLAEGELEDDYRLPLSSSVDYEAQQCFQVKQHSGAWLDQADLDVLLMLFDMCYRHGVADECAQNFEIAFTGRDFLRSIHRAEGGSGLVSLRQALRRLLLAKVEIVSPHGVIFGGSFVKQVLDPARGATFRVILSAECAKLFEGGTWTKINFHTRLELTTDLAKWLYCEFSNHKHPIARDWQSFAKWSGRIGLHGQENQTEKRFVEDLRIALKEVEAATGWECWYVSTGPKAGKVFCQKKSATTRIKKTSSSNVQLNKLDEFVARNKSKMNKLEKEIRRYDSILSPPQASAAKALLSAAEGPSGVSASGEQHPLKIRELRLETNLYVLGQPAKFPKLREHIRAAQVALTSGMPTIPSV